MELKWNFFNASQYTTHVLLPATASSMLKQRTVEAWLLFLHKCYGVGGQPTCTCLLYTSCEVHRMEVSRPKALKQVILSTVPAVSHTLHTCIWNMQCVTDFCNVLAICILLAYVQFKKNSCQELNVKAISKVIPSLGPAIVFGGVTHCRSPYRCPHHPTPPAPCPLVSSPDREGIVCAVEFPAVEVGALFTGVVRDSWSCGSLLVLWVTIGPYRCLGEAKCLGSHLAEDSQPSEVDIQVRNDSPYTSDSHQEMQLGRGWPWFCELGLTTVTSGLFCSVTQ